MFSSLGQIEWRQPFQMDKTCSITLILASSQSWPLNYLYGESSEIPSFLSMAPKISVPWLILSYYCYLRSVLRGSKWGKIELLTGHWCALQVNWPQNSPKCVTLLKLMTELYFFLFSWTPFFKHYFLKNVKLPAHLNCYSFWPNSNAEN